ncbi:MAG: fatty acid desaturase [Hyphomonadaceae bacterium]
MAGSDGTVVGLLNEIDLRRDVGWRDLIRYRWIDTLIELLLPAPWLSGAIWFSARGEYLFALPFTFFLFLTLLRVAHNGYHNALGLPRWATDAVLVLLSPLMMLPLHAVKVTHLDHHRHCMGEADIEGEAGRKSFLGVIAYGPRFPVDVMRAAWRMGSAHIRRRMVVELVMIAGVWIAGLATAWPALLYHAVAMTAGECFTAFFAVWVVHHGTDDHVYPARTQRGWFKNWVSYSMFLHAEHHLFPSVPTFRLRELARRLDSAAPEIAGRQVI